MALRPCLTCGTPTSGTRCPAHRRDRNLATRLLGQIAIRDRWICQLCGQPVTETRGRTSGAPSLDHIDRDVANNHPDNLRLAHHGCNSARG